jgi:spore maturation protein CgeB
MRIGIYWSTPSNLDPNLYLRYSILQASNEEVVLVELDPNLTLKSFADKGLDSVLVVGTFLTTQLFLIDLLNRSRNIPILFWDLEAPYDSDTNLPWYSLFDHVFTVELNMLNLSTISNTSYLPLAADPAIFYKEPSPITAKRLSVIGSNYSVRSRIFNQLASYIQDSEQLIRVGHLEASENDKIQYFIKRTPREIAIIDNLSRASLIVGRDFDLANRKHFYPGGSPGPRLFETILSGGFPIIDATFIDREICGLLFEDLDFFYAPFEAYTIFQNLLDSERIKKVNDLQETLLGRHLYRHRIGQISTVIERIS